MANSTIEEIQEALISIIEKRGCGDHGCVIVKPTGMGTNGGCRCFKSIYPHELRRTFNKLALDLMKERQQHKEDIDALHIQPPWTVK